MNDSDKIKALEAELELQGKQLEGIRAVMNLLIEMIGNSILEGDDDGEEVISMQGPQGPIPPDLYN